MNHLDRELSDRISDGIIHSKDVTEFCKILDCKINDLLLFLADFIKPRAPSVTSGFQVGSAALGVSGNIYLGVNVEFDKADVSQTVHAEQCAILNAYHHGERSLTVLAVTAAPCGYCRQFLYELDGASGMEIILPGSDPLMLSALLPHAFGPKELGHQGGFLSPQSHSLVSGSDSKAPVVNIALECARTCYATYTQAYAGAGIRLKSGEIIGGRYIENAAFNPSLSPLKSALCLVIVAGHSFADVIEVCITQTLDSKIDHYDSAQHLLRSIPNVSSFHNILI